MRKKLLTKVVTGVLAVAIVVTATSSMFVSKSKVSANEYSTTTKTFAENCDKMSTMTDDEFNKLFNTDAYAREFDRTYNKSVTRGGEAEDLAIDLLVNLTGEQVNQLIDKIYEKLPKAVKIFVTREKLNEVIIDFIERMKEDEQTQNKIDEYITYLSEKTRIPKNILKVVVEFMIKYAEELFAEETINPTTEVSATPEVTVIPTEEATVAPSATTEPTDEPTSEVTEVPVEG